MDRTKINLRPPKGGPPPTAPLDTPPIIYDPHVHQCRVHASDAKFRVVVAGRQSGKTMTGIAEISNWVMENTGLKQFWWVTASNKTKEKAWRDLLAHIPENIIRKTHESGQYIEFTNRSRISIRSAEAPESLVGEQLSGFVCDEFAQWSPDVIQVLMPSIGTVPEAKVLFIGTPRGRNWAYDLYHRGMMGVDGWESFHWASNESPYFSNEEFERARRETPERFFRQEYLADFVEGGGEVFRNLENCISEYAQPDGWNTMGVDLARVQDWSVLYVLNSKRETVEIQRFQRMDWSFQKIRLVEMYRRLKCARLVIDGTGVGDPVVEDLRKQGMNIEVIKFTNETKSNIIENLMLLFEQGVIRIPRDDILMEELRGFEFSVNRRSGNTFYEAAEGRHDDMVIALALAAWGSRNFSTIRPTKKTFIPKRMAS